MKKIFTSKEITEIVHKFNMASSESKAEAERFLLREWVSPEEIIKAKKEVFDDIDKSRLVPDDSGREKQYEEIKKRHLSPSEKEGAGN